MQNLEHAHCIISVAAYKREKIEHSSEIIEKELKNSV